MSSFESGLVILTAPVKLAAGTVSLAAAAISAAAEKYRKYRLEQAEEVEQKSKEELDQISGVAQANREQYEETVKRRTTEEDSRRIREQLAEDAARKRVLDKSMEAEKLEQEIQDKIAHMEKSIKAFETEFGQNIELRKMDDTIRQSRRMFGSSQQLVQQLDDLVNEVIPGMAREYRLKEQNNRLERSLKQHALNGMQTMDTSEDFVSLASPRTADRKESAKSPWDRFMERVQAVAQVESAYFESDAAQILKEAKSIGSERRNLFILQHDEQLTDMEEKASEYRKQQEYATEQIRNEYFMYTAVAKNLGLEPRFTLEELTDKNKLSSMRQEAEELMQQYRLICERQYTVNAFTKVMERHHLTYENMTVEEDGRTKIEYSMDEQAGVRITRSNSGAFEMQFQGKSRTNTVSMDERRRVTEKAKHFCSLLPEIARELDEEYGITFQQTEVQPPDTENIEFRTEESSKRPEKARTYKAMELK